MLALRKLCETAYQVGSQMNLEGVHYGPHSRTKRYYETIPYYFLLAGLAKVGNMRKALDIGTHYGGSAMAISRGMEGKGIIVTVDISMHNMTMLLKYPDIRRVQGNSLTLATAREVYQLLPEGVDMIYIDSFHDYDNVKQNIELYGKLSPRLIVFDDIRINESMVKVWTELKKSHVAYDATELCCRNCGFGVLKVRP